MSGRRPVGIVVLCPHFVPDNAPTGTVMTRIVDELVVLGHRVHVVTALPWYRTHSIEPGWTGRWVRRETTPWGSITRVHPFPGDDKSNLVRRAAGFVGYSILAGAPGPARRRLVPPRRCRDRDVAAVDARPHGTDRGQRATGTARLQHPGRLPGCGDRDRGDHRPADHRRSPAGSSGSATAVPTR